MASTLKLLIRLTFLVILLLLLLFCWFKFLKPSEQNVTTVIEQTTLLQEIKSMGKLELVKYHFKEIVEYQKEQTDYQLLNKFLPNAKAVLIVSGEAVGCLDLTRIQETDIISEEQTLRLRLPAPELCQHKIDLQNSKVYDVRNGYLVEEGKIVQEAYQAAEQQIQKSALASGILEKTKANAFQVLTPLLEKASGKKVLLEWPASVPVAK